MEVADVRDAIAVECLGQLVVRERDMLYSQLPKSPEEAVKIGCRGHAGQQRGNPVPARYAAMPGATPAPLGQQA